MSTFDPFGRKRRAPSDVTPSDIAAAFDVPDGTDDLTTARLRTLAQTAALLASTGHGDLAIAAAAFGIGSGAPVPPEAQQ